MQGEDVVAGIRTPEPIDRLAETLPAAYEELVRNCDILERHYKDMQVGTDISSMALPIPDLHPLNSYFIGCSYCIG